MNFEEKYIKSYDGELLYAREYISQTPKAVIILTHDLKEHVNLYEEFATKMQNNFNVFCYDLRAHRNSAKEPFGTYEKDFFKDCLRDLVFINKYLNKKYNLPIINISMGFGGVILTRALQFTNESSLNILIGMPYDKLKIHSLTLRFTTKFKMMFFNKASEAKLTNKYLNYIYSHKFLDKNFQSTNVDYIEKLKADKFCNFNISANILNSCFRGEYQTHLAKNLSKINKDAKFLLISGEFDTVTKFNDSTKHFMNSLYKLGIKNVDNWVLKDMRHNVLNETNSDIVLEDLTNYILEKIEKKC